MADSRLYITLNRASEWRRGLMNGLEIAGNSLSSPNGGSAAASFVTGSVDSAEHNFRWTNLVIDARLPENTIVRVSAYTSDTTLAEIDGRAAELDSYLCGKGSAEEKLRKTAPLFTLLYSGCTDGFINMRGRYIWLRLDFITPEKREIRLDKIKLLLKSESMMEYLPEVYGVEDGENGFLSRFMAIFDSIFFELDDRISAAGDSLDYRIAGGEFLKYLAEWVNIEDAAYLSDETLRKRIAAAVSEYGLTGTKNGLMRWIENEYGVRPNIVEYCNIRKMVREGGDREVYRRLFGDDPHRFFVMLPENAFADIHEANLFMDKLRRRIPADTDAAVITLRRCVILENHTYLGVNSVLSGYSAARTDYGNRLLLNLYLGDGDES